MHIETLTADNDIRQQLWLEYLEGTPLSELSDTKNKMIQEDEQYQKLKEVKQSLLENPPSDFFYKILSSFTPFEQEVMCMLVLGYEIKEISQYNSISEVRLHQMMGNIRNSNIWKKMYGSKERTQRQ